MFKRLSVIFLSTFLVLSCNQNALNAAKRQPVATASAKSSSTSWISSLFSSAYDTISGFFSGFNSSSKSLPNPEAPHPAKNVQSPVGSAQQTQGISVAAGALEQLPKAEDKQQEKPVKIAYTLVHGTHSIQGRRRTMEDEHYPHVGGTEKVADALTQEVYEASHKGAVASTEPTINHFYGIYDGHGGTSAAKHVREHLHTNIVTNEHFNADGNKAIQEGFKKTDVDFTEKTKTVNDSSGTTVAISFVKDSSIYAANTGDARIVLSKKKNAHRLSHDHNPAHLEEQKRIQDVEQDRVKKLNDETQPLSNDELVSIRGYGCYPNNTMKVLLSYKDKKEVFDYKHPHPIARVRGTLAVSRAIGDVAYKPYVSAEPYISITPCDGSEEFMVIGCDGLYDVMEDQAAVDFVWEAMKDKEITPATITDVVALEITQALVQKAYDLSSMDNISITIVFFKKEAIVLGSSSS